MVDSGEARVRMERKKGGRNFLEVEEGKQRVKESWIKRERERGERERER